MMPVLQLDNLQYLQHSVRTLQLLPDHRTISTTYSTQWNSFPAPELYGLSWLDENMSHGAKAGFWLDDTAAYTFVGETTILPRTVV
jgi:hypothetical protein